MVTIVWLFVYLSSIFFFLNAWLNIVTPVSFAKHTYSIQIAIRSIFWFQITWKWEYDDNDQVFRYNEKNQQLFWIKNHKKYFYIGCMCRSLYLKVHLTFVLSILKLIDTKQKVPRQQITSTLNVQLRKLNLVPCTFCSEK